MLTQLYSKVWLTSLFLLAAVTLSAHDCEVEGLYNSLAPSDNMAVASDDGNVVYFVDTPFSVENRLVSTGVAAADRYISNLIFGEESDDLGQAYDKFKKLWKRNGLDKNTYQAKREIMLSADRVYVSPGGSFVCYRVKATLRGSVVLSAAPQTPDGDKMKKQYLKLSNGVDQYFIFDQREQQVVDIDRAFVPQVAARLKEMFGTPVSLYAEDRCLQLLSKKGDERFIFSPVTEKNFTDYFKQLVGWDYNSKQNRLTGASPL